MSQFDVLEQIKKKSSEWVEGRDIAPLLGITTANALSAMNRLAKAGILEKELYQAGRNTRVRFRRRKL